MYCSHCGKKVGETMLFCPFCGDPIVIPDQDEAPEAAPAPDPIPEKAVETPSSDPIAPAAAEGTEALPPQSDPAEDAKAELLDWSLERLAGSDESDPPNSQTEVEPFSPLRLDEPEAEASDWRAEISRRKESVPLEKKAPEMRRVDEDPVRLEGSAPALNLDIEGAKPAEGRKNASRKHANTLVPPKTMNPNDIFMKGKPSAYDRLEEYDPYDDDAAGAFDAGFAYEDAEENSFFMRHLRGIVGLGLFVILLLMFVIYAFSKPGQISLDKVNLAWSTEAYSQLGYQSYQAEQFSQAGLYYERALMRDPENYNYASSAAMAYYQANDVEKASAMLKRCVAINPNLLEPYIYLLKLYPDAADRPWDVTKLLQQGYKQTGDSRLNVTG